jgi:hypothetical protein
VLGLTHISRIPGPGATRPEAGTFWAQRPTVADATNPSEIADSGRLGSGKPYSDALMFCI